jgi:hypothetical protein
MIFLDVSAVGTTLGGVRENYVVFFGVSSVVGSPPPDLQ